MIFAQTHRRTLTAAALTLAAGLTASVHADPPGVVVYATTQTPAPNGNGTLSSFSAPTINGNGRIAFISFLNNTALGSRDNFGQFAALPFNLTEILRRGNPLPGGNGMIDGPGIPLINNAGTTASVGFFTGTSGLEDDNNAMVRGDGGPFTIHTREGTAAPDGNGTYDSYGDFYLDNTGRITFLAYFQNTANGFSDTSGVIRIDGGVVTQLLRGGQNLPDGPGNFSGFGSMAANEAGQAAVRSRLQSPGTDSGVYRTDGVSTVRIAREGQASPDGNGLVGELLGNNFFISMNDAGQVAFENQLTNTNGGASDNFGIFRGNGNTLQIAVRRGQAAPDGNGVYSDFTIPHINNAGHIGFIADYAFTNGGASDRFGYCIWNGITTTQVIRQGQSSIDGNGVYGFIFEATFNNAGQAALLMSLTGTLGGEADDFALLFYNPGQGLIPIIREGDSYLGSTVTYLNFNGDSLAPEGTGLNNTGQVAFAFGLADGREGVAVWTIPAPGVGITLAVAGLATAVRRRRA